MKSYDHWKTTEPENNEPVKCQECEGRGFFVRVDDDNYGGFGEFPYECEACNGSGWLGLPEQPS